MADAIRRVAREAMAALNDQTADDFVRSTTAIFRRPNTAQKPKRGRPVKKKWKANLFLLNKPLESLKSFNKHLLKKGFGPPPENEEVEFDRKWTTDQITQKIITTYPNHPLHLVSFHLARCKKGATFKLEKLLLTTVNQLARDVKAGKLYVVPSRDPPYEKEFPEPESDCSDMETDMDAELPSLSSGDDEITEDTVERLPEDNQVCTKCHRTNESGVCIVCIQNEEYEESLKADRDKDIRNRQNKEEMEAANVELHRLEEIRMLRRRKVPPEPSRGIKIKFMTMTNWEDQTRMFLPTDKLNVLIDYVGGLKDSTEHFTISFPQCELVHSRYSDKTIRDIGILSNTLGRVTWLDKTPDIVHPNNRNGDNIEAPSSSHQHITAPSSSHQHITAPSTSRQHNTATSTSRQHNTATSTSRQHITAPSTTHQHNENEENIDAPSTSHQHITAPSTNEEEIEDHESLPRIERRPQRRAAIHCNQRMMSWLENSLTDSPNNRDTCNEILGNEHSLPHLTSTTDTYRNYMDVICVSDSSDEDQYDSMDIEMTTSDNSDESDMVLTLTKLASTINKGQVTRLYIHRPSVWDSTVRKLKKINFDPHNELLIKFSDDFGAEEGIDQGGPKREFLTLIMEHLLKSSLFEGPENARTISWNKSAHEKDAYFHAGLVMSLSIVHGGPAPQCFAPAFVKALEIGPSNVSVSLEDLPDIDLYSQFEKLLKAKTSPTFQKALDKLSTFLCYSGIDYHKCSTEEDAQKLVKKAVHYYLFDRTSQAFNRFIDGLRSLDVYANFKSLKSLFLYKDTTLNKETVEDLFTFCLSEEGSNDYKKETAMVSLWRDFLEEAEDEEFGLDLPHILQFCTGSKTLPPLGFDPRPRIMFWNEKFPKAETCTNTIYIPTASQEYDTFVRNMKFGILNSQGFMLE